MAEPTREEMDKAGALWREGCSLREVAEHFGWSKAVAKHAIIKSQTGKGVFIDGGKALIKALIIGGVVGVIMLITGL